MSHFGEYNTRRTAEYGVRRILVAEGYEVVRVTERDGALPTLFHLIAWGKDLGIHFIRIGSSRMSSSTFSKEVQQLTINVRTHWYPGDVQFWIPEEQDWERYRILAGGAIPITEQR